MCNPLSMIGFAIGATQQAFSYAGDVQAANDQNRMYAENAARANQNARDQMFQTQQRMLQEQEAAANEKIDVERQARAAKATAAAAAGESGVSGLSVDALLSEFDNRAAEYEDRVDQNTEWTLTQLNNEMKGIRANAEDRINSVQRAAKPSFFDAGLRIAGVGLDSYNKAADAQRNNPDLPRYTPSPFSQWLTRPLWRVA